MARGRRDRRTPVVFEVDEIISHYQEWDNWSKCVCLPNSSPSSMLTNVFDREDLCV